MRLDERKAASFSTTIRAIGTFCLLPRQSGSNFLARQALTANRSLDCQAILTYLRRFEHFGAAKYLSLLEPTPEGRHYNEFGAGGAAVILGGG